MRKTIVIVAIAIAAVSAFASCSSARGGCKMSQGYVGYGSATGR